VNRPPKVVSSQAKRETAAFVMMRGAFQEGTLNCRRLQPAMRKRISAFAATAAMA